MKKYVKFVALFFGLFLVMSLSGCTNVKKKADTTDTWSQIVAKKKVVIGLDDSFVPMGFREKNGKLVGYDIDLAKAVFKLYGITPDFQTIDWSMKETELRNQTIDLIWNGYTKTTSRAKNVAFSDPYLTNEQVLVTKTAQNITSTADMKGKILGLQSGSSGYQAYIDQPKVLKQYVKETIQYDTFNNAFMDLDANRIQGLLIDSVYANYYISHKSDPSSYRTVKTGFASESFVVGMRKGDKTLRKKINRALKILKENGTIDRLNKKWFGTTNTNTN